jgi:hypothetical protein
MDIHDWPKVARPPIAAPLLECRLRVRGERVHRESIFFKWRPDPQALDAGAAGAARWCGRHRLSASLVLSADVAPDVPVDPHVDLAAHLRKTVTEHLRTALFAVRPDRFRIASVHSEDGRLSLVDGGASVEGDWWREALAELTGVLREHADVVVYGFIKRGSAVTAAWLDRSLTRDWPPRPDIKLLTAEVRGAAFQDAYAPDAFGVQLLGPGYAGRIPEGPEWRRERVGDGAVLLEHVDLESWFAHPFGSPESIAAGMPTPPVLMRARTELAPILFTEDVLRQASEDAADIHGAASS